MMSNRRIISGISSAVIGATASTYLLYNDDWCPLGRTLLYLILYALAKIKRQPIRYNYTESDNVRNESFAAQANVTDREYTSQIFKSMSCDYWAVNGFALLFYFAVNSYENYAGDQIVYASAALALSSGIWLRTISFSVIMYSLRFVGVPSIVHLIRAVFVCLCFWICRFPQLDYKFALVMALYNFMLFVEDGFCLCASAAQILPPMLPAIVAIVLFNARPCGILTLMAVFACFQ